MLAGKVGVIENVITQPVRRNGIVDIVAFVCIPVLRQLFRAENKNGFVAVLIILDDRERSKSFAKTDAKESVYIIAEIVDLFNRML